jgi:hypothetical protein
MSPDPEAVHVPPPAPLQVHDPPVSDAGNVSATVTPGASLGPALETVTVYVTDPPATTLVTPSVLVIARSAWRTIESASTAMLLAWSGSVTPAGSSTVARTPNVPVSDGETVADTV